MRNRIKLVHALALVALGIITVSVFTLAQTSGPIARFTANSANVSGAPDAVRIDVLSWSTDADRDQMLGAWNMTVTASAGARGAGAAAGGRGARGGGGGRGGDAPAGDAGAGAAAGAGAGGGGGRGARGGGRGGDAPADAGAAAPANAAAPAAAAGGGGGRGGRGGGRGGAAPAAAPVRQTPETSLAAALQTAKTVGYLWTSESAGYSLRYAYRMPQPDGSERIIFATERRLGAWNDLWKPAGGAAPTNYEFSIIEVRLPAKGDGEGKASLSGKVAVDSSANTIALDGYSALPVVFKDIKRKTN